MRSVLVFRPLNTRLTTQVSIKPCEFFAITQEEARMWLFLTCSFLSIFSNFTFWRKNQDFLPYHSDLVFVKKLEK